MSIESIKEKIANWEIREKLNQNSGLISIAALVVVVAALGWSALQIFGPTTSPTFNMKVTFYDLETKEVVMRNATEIPPLIGASGKPTLVRAYFFTCDGNCKNKKLFYLEKYSDKARETILKTQQNPGQNNTTMEEMMAAQEGLLERLPDWPADKWVKAQSAKRQEVYRSIVCPDNNTPPTPCNE